MKRRFSLCLAVLLVLALLPTTAFADEHTVQTADKLAQAIEEVQSGDTIKLTADIQVDASSTANNMAVYEITASNVTIDGGGHTITVTNQQQGTGYAGSILFGFNGSNASGTIKDLKIEVPNKGVKHAIQAYDGADLTVSGWNGGVEVSGCSGYALVVNGATVEVSGNGLITRGNGSGGINVDIGNDVNTPATLTIIAASIAEETSVKVEHSSSPDLPVTASIKGGSFYSVVNAEGQTSLTKLSVKGGEFKVPPTAYATGRTVCEVDGTTYVNTKEGAQAQVMEVIRGKENCTITVWSGNLQLLELSEGVTVKNMGNGTVTVDGNEVAPGDSYPPQPTEPTDPVTSGGNQFYEPEYAPEYETEPEQSPSSTLRYAVICRTLNVRSGPGTEYSKLGTLSRGTLLDGELLSNGWVKFSYNDQTAYVSGVYVQSVDDGQLSVRCRTLNVRSGPGTEYSKIGVLYRGTDVKPLETQGNWYKISYGWICADYVG